MTAITQSNRPSRSLFLLALLALGVLAAVIATPHGRVKTTSHATERHGSEAEAIRQCIQQKGAAERWEKLADPSVQYWVCELEDGRTCIQINQAWNSRLDGWQFRELTAFCPAKGVYERVIDYLRRDARPL